MMGAMATRFTRLSVVAGHRQMDTSVPASRPVAEFLPLIPDLLSLEPTSPPTAWTLSTVRHGMISPERSLDEVGVLDGDVLYLSPATGAAESPMVEDVLGSIAADVDEQMTPWRGAARDRVVSDLLAVVAAGAAIAAYGVPHPLLSGLLLALLACWAVASAGLVRAREGRAADWLAPAFAGLALYQVTPGLPMDVRLMVGTLGAAAGLAGVALVRRRSATVTFAGTAGGLAALTAVLLWLGASPEAVAGWSAPFLVLALSPLPRLALSTSGLVALVQAGEVGDDVSRDDLSRRIRSASARVNGMVLAVAAAGALAAAVLADTGSPGPAALGLLLGLVFALRSRGFSAAGLVGGLLVAPVLALTFAVYRSPEWSPALPPDGVALVRAVGLVLVLALVAVLGFTRLRELNAARATRVLDLLDRLALVALIPVVLLAQNVFGALSH
jgi:type VII secretion integral membrane protein EccD